MTVTADDFAGFFDDAALFPPGNAPMDVAINAYLGRRATDLGDLVGPFVCPASRLHELAEHLLLGEQVDVAVVADQPLGEVPEGVRVVAVESKSGDSALPDGAQRVTEVPWGQGGDLPTDVTVKLRTGGADASFIPTPAELATALSVLVQRGAPFKLTAGLHRAIRAVDPDDQLVHHGFANVILAVDALLRGGDTAAAEALLAREDDAVGADLIALGPERLRAVRALFGSFGTCSINEPAGDLAEFGLDITLPGDPA